VRLYSPSGEEAEGGVTLTAGRICLKTPVLSLVVTGGLPARTGNNRHTKKNSCRALDASTRGCYGKSRSYSANSGSNEACTAPTTEEKERSGGFCQK